MALKHITKQFKRNNICLKNRFVMPAMVTNYGSKDGYLTKKQVSYYNARAKGGIGLIIIEFTSVSQEGKGSVNGLCLHNDSCIPYFKKVTKAVHENNAKILIQLAHAGRRTSSHITGTKVVSSSAIAIDDKGEVPIELSKEKIRNIQKEFLTAAKRAYESDFDGIEIHGAHGYLIHQFLSPESNHRIDEYGRNFNGRIKFLIEIIKLLKLELPRDFIIGCRLSAEDFTNKGLTIEDTIEIGKKLESLEISYLHISAGGAEKRHMISPPMDIKQGYLVPYAEAVKKKVSIPIITVGRIVDPTYADQIIKDGKADLVAMGRALWADPELPNKVLHGYFKEIRPCIGCNQGCKREIKRCCTVNPWTLRETDLSLSKSTSMKKIMIVGGGPSGLECARISKIKGHDVTLYEQREWLGGNFYLASKMRKDIKKIIQYYKDELNRLDIKIKIGTKVNVKTIEKLRPDVIVLATGAVPKKLLIPGNELIKIYSIDDIFFKKKNCGKKVLIIGGGLAGCEVADYLSDKKKKVILVEQLNKTALNKEPAITSFLKERLDRKNVKILTSSKIIKIEKNNAIIEKESKTKIIESIDSIVNATGYESSKAIKSELDSNFYDVYVIGDAKIPLSALEAIKDGSKLASEI